MDNLECCICYKIVTEECVSKCGHSICLNCIGKMTNLSCPMCRCNLENKNITDVIKNTINNNNLIKENENEIDWFLENQINEYLFNDLEMTREEEILNKQFFLNFIKKYLSFAYCFHKELEDYENNMLMTIKEVKSTFWIYRMYLVCRESINKILSENEKEEFINFNKLNAIFEKNYLDNKIRIIIDKYNSEYNKNKKLWMKESFEDVLKNILRNMNKILL